MSLALGGQGLDIRVGVEEARHIARTGSHSGNKGLIGVRNRVLIRHGCCELIGLLMPLLVLKIQEVIWKHFVVLEELVASGGVDLRFKGMIGEAWTVKFGREPFFFLFFDCTFKFIRIQYA